MRDVFRELSARDKGASKPLREKLDEIRRSKGQGTAGRRVNREGPGPLLGSGKLNIADAMAWQRDAAKAGAPLSREPLAAIRPVLAERVKGVKTCSTACRCSARGRRAAGPAH